MHPLIALFGLGVMELLILAFVGVLVLVVPATVAVVLWAVFRSRGKETGSNE